MCPGLCDHLCQVQPADRHFIGQRRGNHVHQIPGITLAGLFTILGQNREAVSRENAEALTLLLPVIHVTEEGIRLRSKIVVNTNNILVLVERVSILEVDLLLVTETVVVRGMVETSPVTRSKVVDHCGILTAELPGDGTSCQERPYQS